MRINEIFVSLSGEVDGFGNQGGLATFVRLQGCNLNCNWCDTPKALLCKGGREMSVHEVFEQCNTQHVVITGGEPLLQYSAVHTLASSLHQRDYLVTIETNGTIKPFVHDGTFCNARFITDYKLRSSGMTDLIKPEVFEELLDTDVIKFVMKDLCDYRQACKLIEEHTDWGARKIFSPVAEHKNWPAILAQKMIEDRLEGVTLSLQYHKLLQIN